jgi:predicted ATPase
LPLYLGRLAEIELAEQGPHAALSRIEQAQALALETGQRIFDAFLERLHGEALLAVDPADTRPAESAFLTSLELSLQQGARAFGLQAALALAKLYQSTGRPIDAHALLAPALEGFSPTPEMPEIAEARALLAPLAETAAVKAEVAQRQRRLQLQVAYGNALIAARGYGAPETTEAFAKARGVAGDSASERLAADFGLWVGAYLRGELDQMRALAATFLADASAAPNSPEAGVAERTMGVMHTFVGQFRAARPHFERSLALFEPGRDDDLAFRFGHDSGVGNLGNSAVCFWILGEVERGVDFINRAEARCAALSHAATRALGNSIAAIFYLMRGHRSQAAVRGTQVADLARQHDLPMWRAFATFFDWGDESRGSGRMRDSMRRGLELLRAQNFCLYDGLLKSALAEEEAEAGNFAGAIEIVDDALASSARTGQRTYDAELHRLRGEMLLRREPGDAKLAQEALEGAILVAREQGARSFELRAALSLAKLYRSTGRPAYAHAGLAPALEGFSSTPEMPEIAEAQALLAALDDNRAALR